MAIRCLEGVPLDTNTEPFPHVKRAFETIAYAKVSESAAGAKQLGYLRDTDTVSINRGQSSTGCQGDGADDGGRWVSGTPTEGGVCTWV